MATDTRDVAKQSYTRIRSRKLGLWQRRWIVLRRASSKGPCRLEKYADEKTARTGGAHKVTLLNTVNFVSRLTTSVRKHAFSICFQDNTTKSLACDSDLEADMWVKVLVQECFLPQPGLATGEPDVLSSGIQKELEEQFHVYLMPTPKLDVFGECLLQVTHENIYLSDVTNPRLKLVSWPLTALRRYGSDPAKFTFEAGRHCSTGEGMFVFHTLEGEKIYCKIHQATSAIAEAHYRLCKQAEKITGRTCHSQVSFCLQKLPTYIPVGMINNVGGASYSVTHDTESPVHKADAIKHTVVGNYIQNPEQKLEVEFGEGLRWTGSHGATSKCSLRSHLLQCESHK
ncbi:docking protein 5-like isoform X1 [Tachypleus tridentatus]|uniref:docking protein 5-like isoform X1 n=1 Tax=Tachypleus tridentatus TaxID=6853 RepID=UPI003FD05DC2